jgi:hypothetical protein
MFRSSVVSLLVLAGLILAGCSDPETFGAFSVPEHIEAGETIEITYDRMSAESKFGTDDSLWLAVVYYNRDDNDIARFRDETHGERNATFTVRIPAGTVHVLFQVGMREQMISVDEITCIVTKHGVPVAGSLAPAIMRASTGVEAKELFDEDKRLYPESLDRYVMFWMGLGRSGLVKEIDIGGLPKQGNVLEGKGAPAAFSPDMAAVRMLGYFYRAEHDKALRELEYLLSSRDEIRTKAGAEALNMVWGEMLGPGSTSLLPREQIRSYATRIAAVVEQRQCLDPELMTSILRLDRSRDSSVLSPESRSELVQRAVGILDGETDRRLLQHTELLHHALAWLDRNGRSREVIRLIEDKRKVLDRSTEWCRTPDDPYVEFFPSYGVEAQCLLYYGRALLRSGEVDKGEKVLRELLERDNMPDYQYAICRGINELAERAADASDTAEVRQLYMLSLARGCRPEPMEKILASLKIDPKSIAGSSERRLTTMRYRVPISEIATRRGKRNLAASDNVYRLILFTGASCSICRKEFPGIMKHAMAWDKKLEIYYVDVEGEVREKELRGAEQGTNIVLNHKEMFAAFHVRALPEMRLILNGEVILEGVTDAQSFKAALSELKRRRQ